MHKRLQNKKTKKYQNYDSTYKFHNSRNGDIDYTITFNNSFLILATLNK